MKKSKALYTLTAEDVEVFEAGVLNINNFTDFYFRTPTSGTIHEPTSDRYALAHAHWEKLGKTEELFEFEDEEWGVVWSGTGHPLFRHHHGFRSLDWQTFIYHCKQTLRVIAGGFSSGKSLGLVVMALVLAATIEGFKAMCTAPTFFQAKILYKMAVDIMANTLFEERFLINAIEAPFPLITIGNSHVGVSSLEFKSASDDGDSLLSWRGDWLLVDQVELIPDVKALRKNAGSRLVGKSPGGRPYMGLQHWAANAGPNPALWELYDLARREPEHNVSLTVTTYDNIHNSADDIRRLERDVGGINPDGSRNQEAIDQWLLAIRPARSGIHFSVDTLNTCRSKAMEQRMKDNIDLGTRGYVYEEDYSGIFKWFYPYEHGRQYFVVGDPGHANRPDRNSPVVMVWDITNWPKEATLAGFHWLDGNASIKPFLEGFTYLVEKYKAHGQCAFDSTGVQKALDELAFEYSDLMVEGINFTQQKLTMLNALKVLLEYEKLRFPYIGGIWEQLLGYDLPDGKLRQDIVACMMMGAFWLRDRLGVWDQDEDYDSELSGGSDRYPRGDADRYPRSPDRGESERKISPFSPTLIIPRQSLGIGVNISPDSGE